MDFIWFKFQLSNAQSTYAFITKKLYFSSSRPLRTIDFLELSTSASDNANHC